MKQKQKYHFANIQPPQGTLVACYNDEGKWPGHCSLVIVNYGVNHDTRRTQTSNDRSGGSGF